MDALALLCNLHGDGPETLQQLRRSGCRDLKALLVLEPERLAPLLGRDAAAARRFLREAQLLHQRLSPEDSVEELVEGAALPVPQPAKHGAAANGVPPLLDLPGESPAEQPAAELKSPLEALLRALEGAPQTTSSAVAPSSPALSSPALSGQSTPATPEKPFIQTQAPHGSSAPAVGAAATHGGTALEVLCEDRVDRGLVAGLRVAGFESLEALVACDAREGAQRAGVTYTQMLRLQFLARRALRQRA